MRSWTRPTWAIVATVLAAPLTAGAQTNLQRAAACAGLTPTVLTACGLSAPEVAALFAEVRSSPELASVLAAQSGAASAESALKLALRTRDPLEAEGCAAIQAAITERDAARATFDAAIDAFVQRAASTQDGGKRLRMSAWRASPANLPPEFRVVVWTEPESRSLLAAIREERLALAAQRPVAEAAAQLLALARARPEVADASMRLRDDLAAIAAAVQQALQ